MNEPDLDRFSRRLWGERPFREPSEDELADYKQQEDERREERLRLRQEYEENYRRLREPY